MKIAIRALEARVNRALNKEGLELRKSHPQSRWIVENGRYYVVDQFRNAIEAHHVDIEAMARDLGKLANGDEVVY
ncbi:hypothetical protein [Vibrio comitans]|uniref:Uncharacterized protein n=1 Tax=Vibrio comitans NBRC 102076 TaxID=1219078 RepID=A0A4Y3IHD7_9VIBR|nr:hypothetical protein [Vibrio comitans]GEA58909.1 hypothetical protein VCO01S_01020 [Vibrio comitans NBRC 102076]